MIRKIDWSSHESSFDTAKDFVLKWEGGLAKRSASADPGGTTKYGISEKQYGKDYDIEKITQETAVDIFRKDYWEAPLLDLLPEPIAQQVFQFGVVAGQGTSIGKLQELVGTKVDKLNGPLTAAAVKKAYDEDPQKLIDSIASSQLSYLKGLKNWEPNKNGWTNRINDSQLTATESRIRYAERRAALSDAMAELDSQGDFERPAPEPEDLAGLSDFGTAFKTARESGAKVFDYKGKKYTTELKTG